MKIYMPSSDMITDHIMLILCTDKNPENIEEVTKTFHRVQQAYEVLIDAQERAWYDQHREAILRGGRQGDSIFHNRCLCSVSRSWTWGRIQRRVS